MMEIFQEKYASTWEFLCSSLPVRNQNFWNILPFLIIYNIGIPIHLIYSVKILIGTLILIVKQRRIGDPPSLESLSDMGRPTEYRTSTLKATEENNNTKLHRDTLPYSKVQAKVGNGKETSSSPCVSNESIPIRKPDYSKIQAKVSNGKETSWNSCKNNESVANRKRDYSKVQAKVDNGRHHFWRPCASRVKIVNRKLDYSNIQAKVGNGRRNSWSPGVSNVRIPNRKLDYSDVHEKIDNKC
jgi:hypothetical protein